MTYTIRITDEQLDTLGEIGESVMAICNGDTNALKTLPEVLDRYGFTCIEILLQIAEQKLTKND